MADSQALGDFIVHNLATLSQSSNFALLEEGRRIIKLCSERNGWRTAKPQSHRTSSACGKALLVFRFTAPVVHKDDLWHNLTPNLKSWNAPPDPAENFSLDDLKEFESTDLCYDKDLSKSPSLQISFITGALHHLIPEPHYQPSTTAEPAQKILANAKPAYTPSQIRPVSPYSVQTVHQYLQTRYARAAWVIPVRGQVPWTDCSSADVVETFPENNQALRSRNHITWTPESLSQFWSLLLTVRDRRNLGSIALSFHATSQEAPQISPPTTLIEVDHIKVYHDVRISLKLRLALAGWSYTRNMVVSDGGQDGRAAGHVDETKGDISHYMKDAKLVLVNERSQGVCIV